MNWIIVSSKDRGTEYGVGTFIKQLSKGLSKLQNINVFILEIGSNSSKEFFIEKSSRITYLKIPKIIIQKPVNTLVFQTKLAKSIVRATVPYLPQKQKNIIHLNYLFQSFIGEEFKKEINCSIIFTQHLILQADHEENKSIDVEYRTYAIADKIIAVTNHGREHLISKLVDPKKIGIINNGIDPKLFSKIRNKVNIRQKYGIKPKAQIILYCGRLDVGKGLKYIIQSFLLISEKQPDCQLIMAGDGRFEEFLDDSSKHSTNILFLGFLPIDDLLMLYKEALIGIIPSLEEQCSYVALEMLHSGLPVIATKIGGLKEIFVHNENAFLINTVPDQTNSFGIAPNLDQLTTYMYKLLNDSKLRSKFSRNGLIKARKEFSIDKMSFQYAEILTNK